MIISAQNELVYEELLAKLKSSPHATVTEILSYWPAREPIGTPHVIAAVASITFRAASLFKSFVRSRISAAAERANFWRIPALVESNSEISERSTAAKPSNCAANISSVDEGI
jgi:hypothetical protein